MPIETAAAVGVPAKTAWSTTATLRNAQGELYVAAGFSGTNEAPFEGREFISQLNNQQFTDAATVYQFLAEYWKDIKNNEEVAASWSVVWRQGENITLLTFGYGLVGLLRSDSSRWLIAGQQENQVLEGQLKEGDRLILATARVTDLQLPLELWKDHLVEDIGDELIAKVRHSKDSAELALLTIGAVGAPPPSLVDARELAAEGTLNKNSTQADDAGPIINNGRQRNDEPEPPLEDSSSQSAQSHLISPSKLAAGIVANKQEHTPRWQQKQNRFSNLLTTFRQLSWIRLVVVALVVLAVIGGLTWWRYTNIQSEKQEVVIPLQEKVQQLSSYDEKQRLAQRDEANSLLERLKATRVKFAANRRQIESLESQVEQIYNNISGEKEAVNLPVFYDFRLVVANFLATKAARYEDTAVFMDANEQKLISLHLDTKNNETANSEFVGGGRDIALWGSEAYILRGQDITKVPTGGANAEPLAAFDDEVEDPILLDGFGDNLYALDKGSQQIWRTPRELEASSSAWIRSAPGVDFEATTSLVVDGDIWLGTNNGNIYRLRRGNRIDFELQGLLEPFTSTLLLAAADEGEKLVVVEPAGQRLVVFNKEDGVYQQQLESQQLGGVTDIFMNQDETVVYLVAGSVVYRVDI